MNGLLRSRLSGFAWAPERVPSRARKQETFAEENF